MRDWGWVKGGGGCGRVASNKGQREKLKGKKKGLPRHHHIGSFIESGGKLVFKKIMPKKSPAEAKMAGRIRFKIF